MKWLSRALITALLAAGCEGDSGDTKGLTVSAATSLTQAFGSYAKTLGGLDVRYSFAGSDELAAQIRKGVKPDVFASANTELPSELHKEGLLGKPVVFARNRLVIATPRDSSIDSIEHLAEPGTKVVAGSPSVPVGSYTRALLRRLGRSLNDRILRNIRSSEANVGGVVAKVAGGAADAGFVYVTDVAAAGSKLRVVELPDRLQPEVSYAAGVLRRARNPAGAKRFIAGLLRGRGRRIMSDAGFEAPPK